ncbi:MAG: hypothetical protein ACYTGZ_03485 [Planctomycetota bacterium]|jgi:hypothetical protein
MDPGLESPYGSFRAPRLPLDLRCITLGAVGWGTVQMADWALGKAFGQDQPVAQVVGLLRDQIGHIAFLGQAFDQSMGAIWGRAEYDLVWSQALITALVFFGIWSIFGGALLRVAALRLTRNEALGPRAAIRFGAANMATMFAVPLLVGLFIGVLGGLNALVGFIMSIPLLGSSILALVLIPLVMFSSVLLVLAMVGGLLGLPLMWCGVTVERNGALESVSRAFSYVSARPFHFFFSYLLIFVLVSAVTLLSGYFENATKVTLRAGIVRTKLDDAVSRPPPDVGGALATPTRENPTVKQRESGIGDIQNIREVSWYDKPGFFWMWLCLGVFLLGFKGYAIYIFLGGTMSLYLMLRREVDGTYEDEMAQVEEAGDASGGEARWVGEESGAAPQGGDQDNKTSTGDEPITESEGAPVAEDGGGASSGPDRVEA